MKYRLQDVIDMAHFQNLQDRLNEIYSFPSAIIDNDGNILTATAWQDICTKFHRKHKTTEQLCIQSDQYIQQHLHEANPAVSYRCPHGLVDNATPIIIEGIHYGNFFTGQFFMEEPDMDFFRKQAEKYGFDQDAYLEAVRKVPIWNQKQLDNYLFFIKGLIAVISESGLKRLKEIEVRQQIQKDQERQQSILHTAMDGFWLLDINGRLLDVNESYCRMSGFTRDELLNLMIVDLEADECPAAVAARRETIIAHGSDRFESRHRRKDGTIFDVELSIQFHAEDGGQFVCFLRDISERRQIEERLKQSQKLESIGSLAGGIAHDFNNILFPIIGLSEMMMEGFPPESLEYQNTMEIFRAGKRGSDLVQQILTFSRQSEHKMIPVQIRQVLKEALKLCRATIPMDIEINQDIQADVGVVMADPTQIHQVAMNLVTNAYHAVEPAGGSISVQLRETAFGPSEKPAAQLDSGHYAVLSVSDTGTGIDPAIRDKIFDPYFTTKKKGKGTGLGLSTVYGIVKEHGGDITVDSEVGKGSVFAVYLPVSEKYEKGEPADQTLPLPTGTEHILLVDDEEAIARLEEQMLRRLGYHITLHTSSVDALETFRSDPSRFDLVITDMNMPNLTGEQLAKRMMAIRLEIPVIICTGFSERINREKALSEGIKGFLMKPVIRSDMARMVRDLLDGAV